METKIRERGDFSIPIVEQVIEYLKPFIWLGKRDVLKEGKYARATN